MEYLNFSWVLQGRLAGAQGPTHPNDLEFFKLQGVRAVVRMEEMTISGKALELADLYEPVPDFAAPQLPQIERMVAFIDDQLEQWNRPVVVTCQAGMGRTGTVLACYMVRRGYSPGDAINLVRGLRPGSVEARQQEETVYQFAETLKSRQRGPGRQKPQGSEDTPHAD